MLDSIALVDRESLFPTTITFFCDSVVSKYIDIHGYISSSYEEYSLLAHFLRKLDSLRKPVIAIKSFDCHKKSQVKPLIILSIHCMIITAFHTV